MFLECTKRCAAAIQVVGELIVRNRLYGVKCKVKECEIYIAWWIWGPRGGQIGTEVSLRDILPPCYTGSDGLVGNSSARSQAIHS